MTDHSPPAWVTALLEDGVNRLLRLDPDGLRALGGLHGSVICLRLLDLGTHVFVLPSEAGVQLRGEHRDTPTATLSGRLPAFLRLLADNDEPTVNVGGIEVEGDAELARRFRSALTGIRIDWEEQLSRVVGDVLAHELGNAARHAGAWRRHALDVIGRDIAEYLQHESRVLAARRRVDAYLSAVDGVRADADRLEQRVRRLTAGLAG